MEPHDKYNDLLQSHRSMVWRMCWVGARGDAERCRDLVQEVSIALWLHLDKLRPSSTAQQERAWVRWVARTTLDHQNRRQRPPLVTLTDAMAANIPDADSVPMSETVDALMASLTSDEQHLLQLYIEGYRGDEIAAIMGLNRNTVYQRMHRVMGKVRRVVLVLLFLAAVFSIAIAVVPQLRKWVLPRGADEEAPAEEAPRPAPPATRPADTLSAPDADTMERLPALVRLSPVVHLVVPDDTSRPVVSLPASEPCPCSDKPKGRRWWETCDTVDDLCDCEPAPLPDVTVTVNKNIITVEGADNETVCVYDSHGGLVAIGQCIGHCMLIVRSDNVLNRNLHPTPYWVQVGSRPRQQVVLQFP